MFRNMVTSLFKYDRIRTTDVKAKELRRWADQMVTLAKRGDLHARRIALSIVRERDVVQKLFDEAQERYGAVSGGYTRIVKVGRRPGDAAPVSIIELISQAGTKKKKEVKKPKKTVKAAIPATPEAAPPETAQEEPAVETAAEATEADTQVEDTGEGADVQADVETVAEEASAETESAAEEIPTEKTSEDAASDEAEKKEE